MAVPTVTISGHVLQPDGVAPASGTVSIRLSQSGSAQDGAVWERVAAQIKVTLGTGGAISIDLVPNDIISPSGTVYFVTFVTRGTDGRRASWSETWSLESSPDPIDIGAITRVAPPSATFVSGPPGPADSNSLIIATGSTTARALGARFADVVNVKDFGAKGDGATDDTAAIQAALNAALPTGKEVFIPSGTYLVTSPLVIGHASNLYRVRIRGAGFSSKLSGNFAGYILDRGASASQAVEGPHYIEDLYVANAHASGSGIYFVGIIGGRLSGLRVEARAFGIRADPNTFSLTISDSRLSGTGNTGIGIMSGGHSTIANCDIVGWSEGIRARGSGVAIVGGRYEVNVIGILLGKDPDGGVYAASRCTVSGASFETNDTAINVRSAAACSLIGLGAQGSSGSPSGQSQYGLNVDNAVRTTIAGVALSGSYSTAAVRLPLGLSPVDGLTLISVQASNSYGGGSKVWDAANTYGTRFINCAGTDVPPEQWVLITSADRGDTSQTLQVGKDAPVQRWATALTANRTVTLDTSYATLGSTFRVVRTGLGAFTLDVGGLKTIPSATAAFVDVTYNGSAWVLTGYGTL